MRYCAVAFSRSKSVLQLLWRTNYGQPHLELVGERGNVSTKAEEEILDSLSPKSLGRICRTSHTCRDYYNRSLYRILQTVLLKGFLSALLHITLGCQINLSFQYNAFWIAGNNLDTNFSFINSTNELKQFRFLFGQSNFHTRFPFRYSNTWHLTTDWCHS